ncbi:MIP/aquaporin family protein [Suttonella indologenes]|uniref:Glyceroaquaporin n=1 Tax=Suttonella indologenes TaxID=13276 RepID=A0A380N193_9GAMM|nr:MIP/aquaporin family protein [Suttonella indologenes]SUO98575.1 Glyceroaquaporin [Suttonella indologenes]
MSPFMSELVGTMILILLGNGVVANVVLKGTKGNSSGWIVITTAWAFAVYVAVLVSGASGAHLNPAVTIGLAAAGKFAWGSVVPYIIAQFIGSALGALLVYTVYIDHFKVTEDEGAKRACFCTEPAIRNYRNNFISEVIGTFVLIFVILYIVGAEFAPGTADATPIGLGSLGALPVALLVWSIGLSLGGTTGYAINPARDNAPRAVLTFIGSKFNTRPDWEYGWIPCAGPVAGAILAAIVYHIFN